MAAEAQQMAAELAALKRTDEAGGGRGGTVGGRGESCKARRTACSKYVPAAGAANATIDYAPH
jgi:hypothetical protein